MRLKIAAPLASALMVISATPAYGFVDVIWNLATTKGCEQWAYIKKLRPKVSTWDYCYEWLGKPDGGFRIWNNKKNPLGSLLRQDVYIVGGAYSGYGDWTGPGDLRGLLKNENNGKRYIVECHGRRTTGKKYGHCMLSGPIQ